MNFSAVNVKLIIQLRISMRMGAFSSSVSQRCQMQSNSTQWIEINKQISVIIYWNLNFIQVIFSEIPFSLQFSAFIFAKRWRALTAAMCIESSNLSKKNWADTKNQQECDESENLQEKLTYFMSSLDWKFDRQLLRARTYEYIWALWLSTVMNWPVFFLW